LSGKGPLKVLKPKPIALSGALTLQISFIYTDLAIHPKSPIDMYVPLSSAKG
jgi:hypothetical protein